MVAARTSRKVTRPTAPAVSQRAKSGNEAADQHLTTLAEQQMSRGRAILIHGQPDAGKTVLAIHRASRPILVLDADGGLDSVMGTKFDEKVHLWVPSESNEMTYEGDLETFRDYVLAGDWRANYKVIVVDNATAVQKPIIRWAIDQSIERASADKQDRIDPDIPSQQTWGKIYRVFDKWIRDIISVKRRGVHVIFTSGTKEWMDDTAGFTKLMPNIEGQERAQIPTHFDAVGYLEADEHGRRLNLAPSGATVTRVRLPVALHGKIPDTIENPDFNSMMSAVARLPEPKETTTTRTKGSAVKRRKRT